MVQQLKKKLFIQRT